MQPPKELQIVKLQQLSIDIARDGIPYGNQAYGDSTGTVRTTADFQFYKALMGAFGPEGKKLAWDTTIKRPDTPFPVPYDDVTRQFFQTSPELARNDSGFMHQKVPQVNLKPREKRYRARIYAYAEYAITPYLKFKSGAKSTYNKAKAEINNAVAKVYNSGKKLFSSKPGNLEQMLLAPA